MTSYALQPVHQELWPQEIEGLVSLMGLKRLKAALATLHRTGDGPAAADGTAQLASDRCHVLGGLFYAAEQLDAQRENGRALFGVVRSLAKARGRSTRVIIGRTRKLLAALDSPARQDAWRRVCLRANVFIECGSADHKLIQDVLAEDAASCSEITHIAAAVSVLLPDSRGLTRYRTTSLWEFICYARETVGLPSNYVWSDHKGEFTDVTSLTVRRWKGGKPQNPRHAYASRVPARAFQPE